MYDYTVDERKLMMKEAFRGSGIGVIFMAVFGTLWAGTGVMGLQGWGFPYVELAAIFVGIIMVIVGISLIHASQKMSNQVSDDGARRLKRIGFLFNMVFIAEGLLIGVAIAICNLINQTDLIPGVIAIIVGIHFLPLASLFQIKVYYATGVLLCLLALITWLNVPDTVMVGEHQILAPLSLLGFGCSLILWTTGLTLWLGIKNSSRTIADEE
ncbi:DUF7010 family protein [Peribacillus frigoritolerans]|jgi:putative Ca2+/H+ antiporter (TMEM165/GDT1 family)|uniref:DUF7010 family protein n=1 Tax=Peribacillus frigoritolerans TaxID=450367 RepID=UPI0022802D9B|nr:hypothetical protein [Peribacillus frigoritolerans]MCY9006870.1 hypothetical protein [Peribacillus frigoritolerans]